MTLPPATQATLKAVFERLQATRMRPLTPSAALALEAEPMDHSFGAAPFPNSPPPHHPGTGRPSLSSAQPSTPSAAQAGAGAGAGASAGLVTPASATRRGISDPGGSGGGAGGTPSHVVRT